MELLEPNEEKKFQILREVFGFRSFRPGQEEIIAAICGGEGVLAVMPTGSGKSLCFQISALVRQGLTVVVSPLVALMQDQVQALKLAGVQAATINSSFERGVNVATWRRVAKGEIALLYLSPERLMTRRMLEALGKLPLSLLVVDEAHCISQWGPAFRPEYEQLSQLKQIFPDVPVAAFTATADENTRQDIIAKLFLGAARSFVLGFNRPNIRLAVTQKNEWKQQTLSFLENHQGKSGIVYCLSRKKTEETAALLVTKGIKALPYHAGMPAPERQANQDAFMTQEGVVIVATIAFGMGIDKADVRFVLHTDIPATIEAYYQEFGRAGRDEQPAEVLMLYGYQDISTRRRFIEEEATEQDHKRRQHKRLDALVAYCEASECRRVPLLAYFGEQSAPCGNCDICSEPVEMIEGSHLGKSALAAVEGTGQRFGVAHIIDVLRGKPTEKVRNSSHDKLNVFATGQPTQKEEWQSILRQLVAGDFLKTDIQNYGGLTITDKGRQLLRGDLGFLFRRIPPKRKGSASRKTLSSVEQGFSSSDHALLGKLKKLRLDIAKARGVPAFVIFHDRTLAELVKERPTSWNQFARINGVGAAKLEEFAEPFIAEIAAETDRSLPGLEPEGEEA